MGTRLPIPLLLLCLLSTQARTQDTCNRVPMDPIYILSNPSIENIPPTCTSGFSGVTGWYPTTSEMYTGFLNPCTNYLISDDTILNAAFGSIYICLFPIVPQPVPDGKGVLAVSDYGFNQGIYVYPGYKSSATTCLTGTLIKDSLYRLDFFVGFGTPGTHYLPVHTQTLGPGSSPSPETFTLYGMPDCSTVSQPFPILGCPSVAGWTPLGSVQVSGLPGSWTRTSIQFTPTMNINAISIGPSCDTNFTTQPITVPYQGINVRNNTFSFFLDSLQFYQAHVPFPTISVLNGDSCSQSITLQMQPAPFYAAATTLWYRNDTLVPNQTGKTLTLTRNNPSPAQYRVQVQNDSICLVSSPYILNWIPLPPTSALGIPDTTVCQNDTVLLSLPNNPAFHYTWQDGSSLPFYQVTKGGTYTVTISDACGTTQAQKTISFGKCDYNLYVPNAFTPGPTGNNASFRARYFIQPASFHLTVFNRNGLEVFSSADPNQGWDGDYKSTRQPAGTYIYVLEFSDITGKQRYLRGTVVLIR
jgi:gliding motility-associated-like protein